MAKKKLTPEEEVADFMSKLEHPLYDEIEALRTIIKKSDKRINERVKWNAPSYYTTEDIVTFNPRDQKRVHLVFHHKCCVDVKSDLLEGDYKDRRMMYFSSMADVKKKSKELTRIMKEMVAMID